jgi:hypothetical protein
MTSRENNDRVMLVPPRGIWRGIIPRCLEDARGGAG